jgi:hypothetical protein
MEGWLPWVAAAVAVFFILKFVFKPLLKIVAFVALGVAVWWYLGDDIAAWLSSMN